MVNTLNIINPDPPISTTTTTTTRTPPLTSNNINNNNPEALLAANLEDPINALFLIVFLILLVGASILRFQHTNATIEHLNRITNDGNGGEDDLTPDNSLTNSSMSSPKTNHHDRSMKLMNGSGGGITPSPYNKKKNPSNTTTTTTSMNSTTSANRNLSSFSANIPNNNNSNNLPLSNSSSVPSSSSTNPSSLRKIPSSSGGSRRSNTDDDLSDYQNSPTSSDYGGVHRLSSRASITGSVVGNSNNGSGEILSNANSNTTTTTNGGGGGGGPILIVDDCNVTRAALKYLLSNLSLSCVMATSGQEAMDMYARGNKFALVLMDYDMPEMNGVSCTGRIRKIDFEVPIVVLTAYDPSEKERDFLIAGANCVVAKPMTSVTLISILRTYGLLSW
jgi:CheY-like chemotaxis protein